MSFEFTEELFKESQRSKFLPANVQVTFCIKDVVADVDKKVINVTAVVLDGANDGAVVTIPFREPKMNDNGKFNTGSLKHFYSLHLGFKQPQEIKGDPYKFDYSKYIGQVYTCKPSEVTETVGRDGKVFKNQYYNDVKWQSTASEEILAKAQIVIIPF